MKAKFLTAVLILGGLFATARESYGCIIPPVAILTDYPDPVVDGCSVTLDGCSSYDPDGYITQWCFSWDWDSDPTWNYCSTTNCKTTHIYPGPGTYHARLRVKNNQGLYDYDYTWVHVGEPTLELRKGPYLIYDGNNTEMMVLWQLTGDANCTLAWGLNPNCDAGSVQTSEYGTDHQHKYIIPDVNTATKYYYRVEVPDDANYFGSFWNAPDANATGIKFLAYGDTRADSGEIPYDHNNICSTIIDTYEADPNYQTFLLHSGDWVHDGNGESDWTTMYFNRSLLDSLAMEANIPIQGCTGNHEVDGGTATAYEKYWPYSYESGGRYWSFDYGPAHFVVVDQYTDYSDESAQLEWIEADLAASTKEWKFVLLHEPGYSAGGGHDDNTDVQTRIQPLCETYGVDIVFAGHNHYYARCGVNGVKHITTGGGGAPLSEPNENYSEYIEECNSVNHFCKIAISDCQLNFEAVDVNGTVIDSFTLTHRWYVNSAVSGGNDDGTSWENAFDDLQEALNVVLYGDEIWVAEGEGTYKPSKKTNPGDPRSATFQLVEGAAMYGGFAGTETARDQREWTLSKTILSGDINTQYVLSDNSYHVVKGADNAVLDGFVITGGNADGSEPNFFGGGIYCSYTSPTITNCIIVDNNGLLGAGIACDNASPTISNCLITGNESTAGGGIYNYWSAGVTLTNCTFSGNSAEYGGGLSIYQSSLTVTNCIFWADTAENGQEIIKWIGSNLSFSHCDIEGCGGSDEWDTSLGTDGGGNLDEDPHFSDSDDPAGTDGVFGTLDDGFRLRLISRCIDAADGNAAPDTDMCGLERADMDFVINIGMGDPNYADIGAYECDNPAGYTTSFEEYQGYAYGTINEEVDGWQVEDGTATVLGAQYRYGAGMYDYHDYQRVEVHDDTTISYSTSNSCEKTIIRVNCIPSPGSSINVMNGSFLISSIKFGEVGDPNIYVWDSANYEPCSTAPHNFHDIAAKCRNFLSNPYTYYTDPNYSYENTWMEFTIQFDWENHTYDISWAHFDVPDGASIYTGASFDSFHRCYTKVEFKIGADPTHFEINRISISDMASEGGVVGADEDAWLTYPEADILNPLKGQCIVAGPMWYDILGEYIVKCCPADLDTADPNNWIQVCSGRTIGQYPIFLGFWNTEGYFNGDYFLKIEIYDDLKRLYSEGIIEAERTFNGTSKTCKVRYPVIGRAKPRTFQSEEDPDFTINWPGTFPFEFKRIFNNGLRARIFPLFFGWTHNHNIRLTEDSQYDWIMDMNDNPVRDDSGLGVGRLWLYRPLGGGMFIGHVNDVDPEQVIYEPLDNENHYIIRTSSLVSGGDNPVFDVAYVYYAPDGMKMTFNKVFTGPRAVPADEGLVDWMVVAGIAEHADRFGNALEYEWSGFTEQDGNDVFLDTISNNLTPAKLVFTYEFAPGGPEGPQLCSGVTLDDGDPLTTDAELTFEGSLRFPYHTYIYYATRDDPIEPSQSSNHNEYHYDVDLGFILKEIWRTGVADHCDVIINVSHDDKGSLLEKRVFNLGPGKGPLLIEQYNYEYDKNSNLITTIKVHYGNRYNPSDYCLLRKEVAATSPEGALLSKDITTFTIYDSYGEEFNPYDYHDPENWDALDDFYYHAGGGGATDANYYYEDSNFPFKPTTIIEYFDDDGDGLYDRPSKKTTMKYDGRGNTIWLKVYMDSENYVYIEYAYHQDYDFPIRKTTWQGYCHDEGETVITSGAKVEKKWLYGDANGTPVADGNEGDYLVQESILLDDTSGEQWADTFYTYISEGQVKTKEDPEGSITYYTYDSYGFRSKEWQGAILEGGLPTGNPQKRYYYDGLGLKILEADYLGKVQMNVHDYWGRVAQARIYDDEDAMGPSITFDPDRYDDDIPEDDEFDWWENRTLYSYSVEYFHNKPWKVTLPTGGEVKRGYMDNGKYLLSYNVGDQGHVSYTRVGNDGRPISEWRTYLSERITIICIYDSMFRLLHNYSYFEYEHIHQQNSWKYIKHEEYRYDASGNKIYEVVYSVGKADGTFGPGVLEKANSYEYDILGRLTKQVVDCTYGGLNQTTEYGYDAAGNRIYVIDPNGSVIFTDYDNANRKVCTYFATAPVYVPGTNDVNFAATEANAIVRKAVTYYKNDDIKDASSYDYDGSLLACSEYFYDSRGRIDEVRELIADTNDNNQMDPTDDIATTKYYYSDDASLGVGEETSGYHIVIEDANHEETGIRLSYHEKTEKVTYPSGDYEEYIYHSRPLNDPCCKNNGLLEKKAVWESSTKEYITYDYDEFGKENKITYPDEGYLEYDYTYRILGEYGKVKQITDNRDANDRPGDEGSTFTFDYWYLSGKVKSYEDYDGYTVYYDYLRAYDRPTVVYVNEPDDDLIYHVKNSYDLAGRLIDVYEPLLAEDYQLIAGFDYDDNGNRSQLTYYRNGSATGPMTSLGYGYNLDNLLTDFTTTGGPAFTFDATDSGDIDGLGRLKDANETITTTGGTVGHSYAFDYDMRSQLTQGIITNIGSSQWKADYSYKLDGNVQYETIDDTNITEYGYDSDLMTSASSTTGGKNFNLDWDLNGQMTNLPYSGITTQLVWNWDGKLRSGTKDTNTIELQYDPLGNRVSKTVNGSERKYVLDISGKLPVILLELNASGGIEKTYIYADSQIIAQHDGDHDDDRYFYLHDRLGSVRQVIDTSGDLENSYTYDPFGEILESDSAQGAPNNPFMFTGQYFDAEIEEYYLRARMYDPKMMRFTTRDPVSSKFVEPMTLHKYLYCLNDPINKTDPSGETATVIAGAILATAELYNEILETAAYGTDPDNWRFFDLADQMGRLLPVAAACGAIYGGTGPLGEFMIDIYGGKIRDIINDLIGLPLLSQIDELLHKGLSMALEQYSGYSFTSGYGGDFFTTIFHGWVGYQRHSIGITDEEMEEFNSVQKY